MTSTAGRNTLVDDATKKIRQMIFDGTIKPGEMLPSRKELASQLDVGLSTIHEAIKSLHSVGLVESRPGKGTWVRKDAMESVIHPSFILNRFGKIDVATIYEARLMLEVALAELAAKKATQEEIEQIQRRFDAAQEVIHDNEQFAERDWDFHMEIAKAGKNVLIETFYNLSREMLLEFIVDIIKLPAVKEDASAYHKVQVEAIARHDVEASRKAAYDHMLYLRSRMNI
jgi:GntR family transcriptional repressor for pyruvate dehydrogenase complex